MLKNHWAAKTKFQALNIQYPIFIHTFSALIAKYGGEIYFNYLFHFCLLFSATHYSGREIDNENKADKTCESRGWNQTQEGELVLQIG